MKMSAYLDWFMKQTCWYRKVTIRQQLKGSLCSLADHSPLVKSYRSIVSCPHGMSLALIFTTKFSSETKRFIIRFYRNMLHHSSRKSTTMCSYSAQILRCYVYPDHFCIISQSSNWNESLCYATCYRELICPL